MISIAKLTLCGGISRILFCPMISCFNRKVVWSNLDHYTLNPLVDIGSPSGIGSFIIGRASGSRPAPGVFEHGDGLGHVQDVLMNRRQGGPGDAHHEVAGV